MNATNENNRTKKLVGETARPTMQKPIMRDNKTNFRSYLRNFLQGIAETVRRYNEFEYGDSDEKEKTPWLDKRS